MGAAAGAAAAMAAGVEVRARDVPVDTLQRTLERHGANLTPGRLRGVWQGGSREVCSASITDMGGMFVFSA